MPNYMLRRRLAKNLQKARLARKIGANKYFSRKLKSMAQSKQALRRTMASELVLGGFPRTKMVRLRFVDEIRITPTGTTVASAAYTLNGIYDPVVATGGFRPRFAAQWDALYNKYTVLGAKITVKYQPRTAADADGSPGEWGIYIPHDVNDLSLPPYSTANVSTINEYRGMHPVKKYGANVFNPRGEQSTITKKRSMKQYFRTSDLITNNPTGLVSNYSGLTGGLGVGSNPSYACYAIIYAKPTETGIVPISFNAQVLIEYIILYEDVKEPSISA